MRLFHARYYLLFILMIFGSAEAAVTSNANVDFNYLIRRPTESKFRLRLPLNELELGKLEEFRGDSRFPLRGCDIQFKIGFAIFTGRANEFGEVVAADISIPATLPPSAFNLQIKNKGRTLVISAKGLDARAIFSNEFQGLPTETQVAQLGIGVFAQAPGTDPSIPQTSVQIFNLYENSQYLVKLKAADGVIRGRKFVPKGNR